ncbi:MAG: integrase arm-type DNA-binding domain-containing protein [Myxococcota bacterium]
MSDAAKTPKGQKPKGAHKTNKLNAAAVQRAKPGRHSDGGGLFLEVNANGSRRWMLRVVAQGRRRDIGLGGASYVSLAEAREMARHLRSVARKGGDPIAERDKDKRKALTFEEAAWRVHAEHYQAAGGSEGHAKRWMGSLSKHAFPTIGAKSVDAIEQGDVLRVLSPIWHERPETARRVRRRISQVLQWARAAGLRSGDNPVELVKPGAGLAKQRDKVQHFRALPFDDLPVLWPRLIDASGMGAAALRFTILTAARSGEVRGATWAEFDLESRVWTIPEERMKGGVAHRVPLSDAAVSELRAVRPLSEGRAADWPVFPGQRGRPLSDMTLAAVLKRLDVGVTVHGFRSTFRDWAEERSNARHEIKEAALAHKVPNRVEAAYRRTDLFDARRDLMDRWAQFATGATGDVVRLQA